MKSGEEQDMIIIAIVLLILLLYYLLSLLFGLIAPSLPIPTSMPKPSYYTVLDWTVPCGTNYLSCPAYLQCCCPYITLTLSYYTDAFDKIDNEALRYIQDNLKR
jgi:hypothetical protein